MLKAAQQALRKAPFVHRSIRAVWTPPERVWRHLYFDGQFTVDMGGASFRVEAHGEQIENDLFWRGYGNGWEGETLKLWRDLAKVANHIVDVGANTGVYALAAQAINPQAKVTALEPSPAVFRKLQRNIQLNRFPINALQVAASDKSGTATLYDFPGEHQYSASLEAYWEGTEPVEVDAFALDELLDRADLVKLDVERHELSVLDGMPKLIERCHPKIIMEVLDAEMEQELLGRGVKFRRICPFNVLIET